MARDGVYGRMRVGMRFSFFLIAAMAASQPLPEKFPIETLKVAGNRLIRTEKIIAVAGLKTGTPVAKPDFDAARARLLATGAFESVGYEFKPSADNKGYDAAIEVIEVEQLFPYRFEDLPAPDDALRAALKKQEPLLGDEIPASKEVLDRYAAAAQQVVGDKVKVIGKVINEAPGGTMIVFRPNTPRAQIAEVKFTGNSVLPSTQLNRALADVAVGTGYTETNFRLLLDSAIRPLYEARGRIRVSFPKITTENSMLADGVVVTTTVDEGPSYSLGKIQFSRDNDELQKVANIQPNDIANFDDVKAGIDRVLARYRGRGYLHASAKLDRTIDDKAHKVDVSATIETGPQYTMGKLEISGLDITSEPAIRKIWTLKSGAP